MLTPPGRGAVAIVNVRGPLDLLDRAFAQFFKAANGRSLSQQKVDRIYYGHWGTEIVEDLVICRTDEVTVEVNCHGGLAAPRRILNDLESAGFEILTWQEQLCETIRPFDVECQVALTKSPTERTALWLLRQEQGRLRTSIEDLLNVAQADELATRLKELVRWGEFGLHLTEPWRVVIAGRPNVGKSTLLNALLGYRRAIVFDQPGTTRDVVTGDTAFEGWPMQLADTAGLRETSDELEADGISRAKRALAKADCACFVFDLSQPPSAEDAQMLALAKSQPRSLLVGNKSDLPRAWPETSTTDFLCLSAAAGTGLEALMRQIVATLIPQQPEETAAIPVTRRQLECLQQAIRDIDRNDRLAATSSLQTALSPTFG